MRANFEKSAGRVIKPHRYEWLWEPLETDPGFELRAMFGAKTAYLDGKLMCAFIAKEEPWRGLLVCTEHTHHVSLVADFSELIPHPILPKWLYLPESADSFERVGPRLVELARHRDLRIGVMPQPKKNKSSPRKEKRSADQARPRVSSAINRMPSRQNIAPSMAAS